MIAFALAKSGQNAMLQQTFFDSSGELIRDNAQQAFPMLVAQVLPVGVRGIVVAGLLAALMSSLAGAFNVSSALFTMDFYSRFKPEATQKQLVWIGRVATVVMVLIGLAWIPVIQGGKGLYDYLQGVQAYLAPPIFVVFFLGVFVKRLERQGRPVGPDRRASPWACSGWRWTRRSSSWTASRYAEGSFFWIVNNTFFQYYCILILLVCAAVMYAVSYMSEEPDYAKISGLTYGTVTAEDRAESRASWNKRDVIASAAVLRGDPGRLPVLHGVTEAAS